MNYIWNRLTTIPSAD